MSASKKPKAKVQVPRKLEEIHQSYFEYRNRAGDLLYQIHVYEKELATLKAGMESFNYEAAARQKLDKEEKELTDKVKGAEAAAAPTPTAVAPVQEAPGGQ